jgi:hypothetical protein
MTQVADRIIRSILFCDVDNQIWYKPLADATIRSGFTPIAIALAGDVWC